MGWLATYEIEREMIETARRKAEREARHG